MKEAIRNASTATTVSNAREFDSAHTPAPQIAILGQSPFTTLITNSGAGQTRFGEMAVTRWRADPTLDDSGHWCYVNDVTSDQTWSTGFQPTCAQPEWYKARFTDDCVSFHRRDGEIETLTEIVVSAEDAVEIRRITLTNKSSTPRELELTSCAEIVIASFSIDRGHPAFSNLFVQTEWIPDRNTVLAMRRPRSSEKEPVWCGQSLCAMEGVAGNVTCETDRAQFIGRGRSYRKPIAMGKRGDLSGTTGAVLDPVFALRTRFAIAAGESASVAFATFVAADRKHALQLASECSDSDRVNRIIQRARSADSDERGQLYQSLAGHLLFPRTLSSSASADRNELEYFEISGELPIVLATLERDDDLAGLAELLGIHRYWREHGVRSDLVILVSGSNQLLEHMISDFNSESGALRDAQVFAHPGSVILEEMSSLEEMQLDSLRAAARLEIACDGFDVRQCLDRLDSSR
jgi:cyclic beta-1,2-glucan synthetase